MIIDKYSKSPITYRDSKKFKELLKDPKLLQKSLNNAYKQEANVPAMDLYKDTLEAYEWIKQTYLFSDWR